MKWRSGVIEVLIFDTESVYCCDLGRVGLVVKAVIAQVPSIEVDEQKAESDVRYEIRIWERSGSRRTDTGCQVPKLRENGVSNIGKLQA